MVQVGSLASEKNCNPLPPQVTVVTVEAEVHVINPTYLELNIESSVEEMQKGNSRQIICTFFVLSNLISTFKGL